MKQDKNATNMIIYFIVVVIFTIILVLTSCSTSLNKVKCEDTYEFGKIKRTCTYD